MDNNKYDEIEFIIPVWAICALISGDVSGLDKDDIAKIEEFEKKNPGIIIPCPDEEGEFYYRNGIDGSLGADAYFIKCLVPKLEKV